MHLPQEMCPECDVEKIPASGPSPVLLRPRQLGLIGPDWETYSYWIENNKEANEKLGGCQGCGGQGRG